MARQTGTQRSGMGLLGGLGLGAALMYFLDPARGKRRRHLVRDQLVHAGHVTGDALDATSRDLRNRARGAAATARARVRRDDADDAVVTERVRSALGRVVSHPSAITVVVAEGRVTLGGPVLAGEVDRLLRTVRGVRGVTDVEHRLEVHESAANVPALQGGRPRTGGRPEFAQENWTPAARLLAGAAGGTLALYAARRRDALGTLLGVGGVALAARGASNLSARRLTGVGAGRHAVRVRKTITINAPVERVFEHFAAWERWPSWMSHVREVRRTGTVGGDERTHWVVDGPAGVPIAWDAVTTRLLPNEVLAWKSVEGAAVAHAGLIRFVPTADGATTVDVQMSYNPPAGAIGHAVAAFFGRDPRHQMDDDLARLKTTIETGTPPHDATRRDTRPAATAAPTP
ncbi:MAG TPA: SRPBCC family protein [Gemmatimonadaceae bacterium]|nr:SRPBCC family protein [Gemmatimonadaceae bacterium]